MKINKNIKNKAISFSIFQNKEVNYIKFKKESLIQQCLFLDFLCNSSVHVKSINLLKSG